MKTFIKKSANQRISKLFIITLTNLLISSSVFAQTPEKISYQAVIRNSSNNLVTSTAVGMQISVLQGSISGTAVYIERQYPTTNANGLISIEVGSGLVVSGNFTGINWSSGSYFIKTETDLNGGENYTITGISQLTSVPYALHAKTAENGITAQQASDITANNAKVGVTNGTTAGQMLYWNGTAWIIVAPGKNGQTLVFLNGAPTWWPQGMGTNDVYNPTTGKVWMDRNLGATQVATSITNAAAYGYLYQWGRGTDGHEIRTSGATSTLSSSDVPGHGSFIINASDPYDWRSPQTDNLWQGTSGINNPCPNGYRLPTATEWDAERLTWSTNNAAGAFNSPLKLPVAGYRDRSTGSLLNVGLGGNYWSSSVAGTLSRYLIISSNANTNSYFRASGFSVRCLKD